MKHLFFWGGVLLTAAVTSTACNEEKATGYSGTNKIYLTATDNNAVITESDATPLEVEVSLTSSVETTTTLTFRLEDDTQELLRLEGNPVTIAAGSKTASFQVISNLKNLLAESTYISVGIDAAQLPQGMELAEALRIRVNPNPAIPELTEEQKNLYNTIESYNLQARNNQEKFKASITKTESMESSYKLLNEQFENGLKNVVELLTGKDDLLQAQQEKLQSKYTTLLNIQLLKFYQGNSMTL